MKPTIAIIAGSAAGALEIETDARSLTKTPYGVPSSALMRVMLGGQSVLYLLRHGEQGAIPPHLVNYRANMWALRELGVQIVIATNSVGVIDATAFVPGEIAIPDQLIDYTWGRPQTFETDDGERVRHVEFTEPFDAELRGRLATLAAEIGCSAGNGVYGVTQGPRLETAAEIARMARDGCSMVGMTAMPEAGLARELGLRYAICAVGVNYAAGRDPGSGDIHGAMAAYAARGMAQVRVLLERIVPSLRVSAQSRRL